MTGARWRPRTADELRARNRARSREQRGGRGYDGVTDEQIFRRDKWVCLMPVCACPDGRLIDRTLAGTGDEWAPSVDHIVQLSQGGRDDARNKRTAHARCNWDANAADQALQAEFAPEPPVWPVPPGRTVADALAGRDYRHGGRVYATIEDLRRAWAQDEAS